MARRKNPWGLILVPLVLVGTFAAGTLLFLLVYSFHQSFIPDDALLARWTRGGGLLMFIPIFFPSLLIGMLAANGIAYLIPPIRRMFEGPRGGSFGKAMKPLVILALITLPLALLVSALGAMNYYYIAENGIVSRPVFSSERRIDWTQIHSIDIRCLAEGHNLHLNYRVEAKDGTVVDLMQEAPAAFAKIYPRLRDKLEGGPGVVVRRQVTRTGDSTIDRRFSPETAAKIRRVLREEGEKP